MLAKQPSIAASVAVATLDGQWQVPAELPQAANAIVVARRNAARITSMIPELGWAIREFTIAAGRWSCLQARDSEAASPAAIRPSIRNFDRVDLLERQNRWAVALHAVAVPLQVVAIISPYNAEILPHDSTVLVLGIH